MDLAFMHRTGMINARVFGGTQPDITRVPQMKDGVKVDGEYCDHNCLIEKDGIATGGHYFCTASSLLNPGIDRKGLAPPEVVIPWLKTLVAGSHLARDRYMINVFPQHCAEWEIPPAVAEDVRIGLTHPDKKVEINLFGGDPLKQPQIWEIVSEMQRPENGALVNVTATGRDLLMQPRLLEGMISAPPNVFALSFDDLTASELRQLNGMTTEALRAKWVQSLKTEKYHGQRHKALEAVQVARIITEKGLPTMLLFNMVIHGGNVDHFNEMVETLGELYPKSMGNPYMAQGSMNHQRPAYTLGEIKKFRLLNDWLIAQTLAGHPNINRRLHYYLFMKAIFETWSDQPEILADWIFGYEAWKCYKNPGATRYVQLGGSSKPWSDLGLVQIGSASEAKRKIHPGGHLSCFWNGVTVTQDNQLGTDPAAVADYILGGAGKLAAASKKPCPGCIMPRLIFDFLGLQDGMNDLLKKEYLVLRRTYTGF